MKNLSNRVVDENGNVVYFTNGLLELMYNDKYIDDILYPLNDEDIKLFNKLSYENYDEYQYKLPERIISHEERKQQWFYPEDYDKIDLDEYFLNLCQTDVEKERVSMELNLFHERRFDKFLRYCIFLSDEIKKNKWIVGVGRGSSCCVYCFKLLDIHMVDSIKYDLDIKEFFK